MSISELVGNAKTAQQIKRAVTETLSANKGGLEGVRQWLDSLETLKRSQVEAFLNLGTSALYDHVRSGVLPPPIKMNGTNASQWLASELTACKAAMIAGASAEELKALVANLVTKRQEFKKLAVAA